MPLTTIKVSTDLRDRIAAIAEREHTTLAGAIERSLEVAEEAEFWDAVDRTMNITEVMNDYAPIKGTIRDGLEPEDWSELL